MLKKIESLLLKNISKSAKIYIFGIIIILLFILIYFLNYNSPLFMDDWTYSFCLKHKVGQNLLHELITGKRIGSLKDIIQSQFQHYLFWGGRSVAHTIVQLLLYIGKPYNKILNSLVFVFLTLVIYKLSTRKKQELNIALYICIILLIFAICPSLGFDILWITGSGNYLWTSLFLLLFLIPFKQLFENIQLIGRTDKEKNNWFKVIYLFFGGIIAGWTNENMVFSCILIIAIFYIYLKKEKYKVPYWFYSGILGFIIGYIFLICAPGNFARAHTTIDYITTKDKYISIVLRLTVFIPIIVTYIATILLQKYSIVSKIIQKHTFKLSFILLTISVISFFVMIIPPVFPEWAAFGICIFGILAIATLINNLNFTETSKKLIYRLLLYVSIVIFILYYSVSFYDLKHTYSVFKSRSRIIEDDKNKNIDAFSFPCKRKPYTKLNYTEDLSDDSNYYINMIYSKYHRIKSISIYNRTIR